jgi:hypothetical protein
MSKIEMILLVDKMVNENSYANVFECPTGEYDDREGDTMG